MSRRILGFNVGCASVAEAGKALTAARETRSPLTASSSV